MVWDLRRALLAKEEIETARLVDFEFREVVRALKLIAERRCVEVGPALDALVEQGLATALVHIDAALSEDGAEYLAARNEARRQLVAERGDPTPHRLG